MKLIFVYNADSGLFNTVTDIAHKILSPATYSCNLCALTHDHFKIREEWVNFLQGIDAEMAFLHRDEFIQQYHESDTELPAIFLEENGKLSTWLDHATINRLQTLDDLKKTILEQMKSGG